eukprot:c23479_g1_i1 orf=531-2396(+)
MGTVNEVFWTLADKADKKFSRLRDLPPYGGNRWDSYFNKAFQVYTKLWKFQQENRQALVDAGLKRWEIGEIASRIGQLYYNYYMRTSDAAFLSESYIFYEAIMSREYFKDVGKDVTLANKQLRFYARFIVVCLLLNRREMAIQLTWQLRTLVDDYRRTFQGNDSKEWKGAIQDITRFMKADAPCQNSRPLRYSVLLDSLPTSFPPKSGLGGRKHLNLKDAILVSYHHNEVKFSELTLDTFRFLQCLEWEPSGSFYRSRIVESNGTAPGHAGPMRVDDIMDQSLPPNTHKYILHRPSVLQLLLVMATACEELPADSIILLYLSALGKKAQNGASRASLPASTVSVSASSFGPVSSALSSDRGEGGQEVISEVNEMSPSSSPDHVSATSGDTLSLDSNSLDAGLWFGSRGGAGLSYLYPADLLPFTRRPLFIIVDSNKSAFFEVIHGDERGEPSAMFLSPTMQPDGESGNYQERGAGSFFTFFLTAPFLAFCQLVNIPVTTLTQGTVEQMQKLLSSLTAEWGKILSATALDPVWVRLMWDPFLRQLLIRFIFCRACLGLHRGYRDKREYSPRCLPSLPKEVLPTEAAIEEQVFQLASHLGVIDQFGFATKTSEVEKRLGSQKL